MPAAEKYFGTLRNNYLSTVSAARTSIGTMVLGKALLNPAWDFEHQTKTARLPTGLVAADALLNGGLVRGRISELIGPKSSGKTSLAAVIAAQATIRGELVAWVDPFGTLDPSSFAKAGVDLSRLLWIFPSAARKSLCLYRHDNGQSFLKLQYGTASGCFNDPPQLSGSSRPTPSIVTALRAAEVVLEAGGFSLLVLDLDGIAPATYVLPPSMALKLAQRARQSNAIVLVLANRRTCGTFSAVSITLKGSPKFSIPNTKSPSLLEGIKVDAQISHNKLGLPWRRASWNALIASQSCSWLDSVSILHSRPYSTVQSPNTSRAT